MTVTPSIDPLRIVFCALPLISNAAKLFPAGDGSHLFRQRSRPGQAWNGDLQGNIARSRVFACWYGSIDRDHRLTRLFGVLILRVQAANQASGFFGSVFGVEGDEADKQHLASWFRLQIVIEARVAAIHVRRPRDVADQYKSRINPQCESWEMVVPELVFAPGK